MFLPNSGRNIAFSRHFSRPLTSTSACGSRSKPRWREKASVVLPARTRLVRCRLSIAPGLCATGQPHSTGYLPRPVESISSSGLGGLSTSHNTPDARVTPPSRESDTPAGRTTRRSRRSEVIGLASAHGYTVRRRDLVNGPVGASSGTSDLPFQAHAHSRADPRVDSSVVECVDCALRLEQRRAGQRPKTLDRLDLMTRLRQLDDLGRERRSGRNGRGGRGGREGRGGRPDPPGRRPPIGRRPHLTRQSIAGERWAVDTKVLRNRPKLTLDRPKAVGELLVVHLTRIDRRQRRVMIRRSRYLALSAACRRSNPRLISSGGCAVNDRRRLAGSGGPVKNGAPGT